MSEVTKTVIDNYALGRKGTPRYPEAYGRELPTKIVPVDENGPIANHPGLDPVDIYRLEIQAMIDRKAQEKQYDSGSTIASYVSSTVPEWATDALAFVAWRDSVWVYAFAQLTAFQSGQREQPSIEDFLAELPVLEWPE